MSRRPRIHYPGTLYHVVVRGSEQKKIFFDDVDRCRVCLFAALAVRTELILARTPIDGGPRSLVTVVGADTYGRDPPAVGRPSTGHTHRSMEGHPPVVGSSTLRPGCLASRHGRCQLSAFSP